MEGCSPLLSALVSGRDSSLGRPGAVPQLELAAAVVVVKDRVLKDRVLIVSRSLQEGFLPGQWGVPCGKVNVEEGESWPQAALRELREETGLSGAIIGCVGTSPFESTWRDQKTTNMQHNYLVRAHVDPRNVDDEGLPRVDLPQDDQESRWVPADDIESAGLDPHNLRTVQQGLDHLVAR
jgi:8-oxo-dGTP diphosphatase